MDKVKELYGEYIAQVQKLEKEKKIGDGLFGMGKKISDDPCHECFSDKLEKLLKEYAVSKPASAEIREVLSYIYSVQKENKEYLSAYWLMNAVHGFTFELIDILSREDASAVYELYDKNCPRRERFPVQKKVLKALKIAAE
ncbi:hypothetical protein [Ruminococcus sp.]|uniref:hypothetical protein n=1 Tax=Ruminococcus sp. TaxID=41978 RepID=UPI0025FA186F|nr:hypothetical protein [Ruminococcus sp.]